MTTYAILGTDAATNCRRTMMQVHGMREGWLSRIVDSGQTTCGPDMRAYLDRMSSPASTWRVFQLAEVAAGLGIGEVEAAALARRMGLDRMLYSMADAMAMLEELARPTRPDPKPGREIGLPCDRSDVDGMGQAR